MTTTIHATGPLYVGGVWTDASLPEFFTVLHVLVWVVFELSLVVACAAMVVVAFSGRGDSCGPPRAAKAVPLALVVSFVTADTWPWPWTSPSSRATAAPEPAGTEHETRPRCATG